jgi:hypothetical protein
VYVAPTPVVVDPVPAPFVPAPAPRLPKFGIGAFAGSVASSSGDPASDGGLVAQYNFTPRFGIEGELSQGMSTEGEAHGRVGAALTYQFRPWSRLSPVILAGTGVEAYGHVDGDTVSDRGYAELGLGLGMSLGRHLRLTMDVRAGVRDQEPTLVHKSSGTQLEQGSETEDFSRFRLGAMFMF